MSGIKKHIIIGIRYSILVNEPTMWVIGKNNSFENYKKEVLDPARLATREAIFSAICLPSLINLYKTKTADTNLKVIIATSSLLPQKNKDFLDSIQRNHPFIEISYHSPEDADVGQIMRNVIDETVKKGEMYASVRLDDDDALSIEWIKKITTYLIPQFNNLVISLSSGLALLSDKFGNIKQLADYKWRFGSVGLTYIGTKNSSASRSIYHCGRHLLVDHKFPSVTHLKGDFIIRTFNDFNDSDSNFPDKNLIEPETHQSRLKNYGITPNINN